MANAESFSATEESGAAFGAVKDQFDAFTRGELHPARLISNLKDICRTNSDVTWEALSLTDQYHRRGLLNTDIFINAKSSLNAIAFGTSSDAGPSKRDDLNDVSAREHPTRNHQTREHHAANGEVRRPIQNPSNNSPSSHTTNAHTTGATALGAGTHSNPEPASAPKDSHLVEASAAQVESRAEAKIAPGMLPSTEVAKLPLRATAVLMDRYVLIEPIHSTATATIFKAFDRKRSELSEVERFVSIKGLNAAVASSREVQALLHDEFLQSKSLSHPNILATYDYQADREASFLVQALLEGQLLSRLIERQAPRKILQAQALAIVREIGLALAYAHEKQIVHGALNADMVIIGSNGAVRVFGFGSSGASQEVISARSGLDIGQDVFALASIAYELLAGHAPFVYLDGHREQRWKRVKSLTRKQWHALERGLQSQRSQRPTNIREWVMSLIANDAATFLPSYDYISSETPKRRRWLPVIGKLAAAAVVAAVIAGGAYLAKSGAFKLPVRPNSDVAQSLLPPAAGELRAAAAEAAKANQKADVNTAAGLNAQSLRSPRTTRSSASNASVRVGAGDGTTTQMSRVQNGAVRDNGTTAQPVNAPVINDEGLTSPNIQVPPDAPAKIAFSTNNFTVANNESVARVNIVRRGGTSNPIVLKWRTLPGSAKPDADYAATTDGEVRIAAGETHAAIIVPIVHGDTRQQASKWFDVEITEVTNATLASATTATVVIVGVE